MAVFSLIMAIVLGGCRCGCEQASAPVEPVFSSATKEAAFSAADKVLVRMSFEPAIVDAGSGIIETKPMSAAQFFELWRNDNVGACNWAEANLQDVRRRVRVEITEQADGKVCVVSHAYVERLSLPERDIIGSGSAAAMFTRSSGSLQKLQLNRDQRAEAEWVYLGEDNLLAAEVLERIEKKLMVE
ncbi:MAG: hypothetical protein PHF37_07495 [Phycisphaerae bacterium]|nr:hypothetical protein [Phycisphaerae bacterium]